MSAGDHQREVIFTSPWKYPLERARSPLGYYYGPWPTRVIIRAYAGLDQMLMQQNKGWGCYDYSEE